MAYLGLGYNQHHDDVVVGHDVVVVGHADVFVGHDDNVVFNHDDDVVGHDDDVVGHDDVVVGHDDVVVGYDDVVVGHDDVVVGHDDDAIIDKAGDWVGVLRPEVGDLGGHQGHDRRWSDVDVFFAAKTHFHQGIVISFKK